MPDIATLGLKIDATGAIKATEALSTLAATGKRAEQATEGVERATKRLTSASDIAAQKAALNARAEAEWRARQERDAGRMAVLAGENARKEALARTEGLQRQFAADVARIKEGQARGFISPAEAREAGREAAVAYNQGLISVQDRGAAAGAFRGAAGQAAYVQIAGSLKNVAQESGRAQLGLYSVRSAMTSVAQAALYTAPGVGQLVSVVGSMALGTGVMIGIMGGLAAVAYGWQKWTEKSREAKKATEDAIRSLDELAKRRQEGPEGAIPSQVADAKKRIAALVEERDYIARQLKEIQDLRANYATADIAALRDHDERRLSEIRKSLAEETARVEAGEAELRRIRLQNTVTVTNAQQEAALAGTQGVAQERLRIEYDAANKAIAARAELTGDALTSTLSAISAEKDWRLVALNLKTALEETNEAIKQRAANADAIRRAEQALELAKKEGVAQQALRIDYDALNKSIQTRRDLTGKLLEETLRAIQAERELARARLLVESIGAGPTARVSTTGTTFQLPNPDRVRDASLDREAENMMEEAGRAERRRLNETMDAVKNVTSSFGDLADVLNEMNPALAGALRGASAFINGLTAFREGQTQSGALGILSQVSGAIGMAAGVIQVASAIISDPERENLLRQNNEALDRLRQSMENPATFRDDTATLAMIDAIQARRQPGRGGGIGLSYTSAFSDEERAQIKAAAERFGLDVFDKNGNIIKAALQQLEDALRQSALSVVEFGKTLAGQKALEDARLEIFDITDPAALAQSRFAQLAGRSPELFGDLSNINLSSQTGRDVLETRLRDLVTQAIAGGLSVDQLGGFGSIQDLLDSLVGMDQSLDSITGGLDDFGSALGRVTTDFPRAMDLILYEQKYGTGPNGGGTGGIASFPPRDTRPSNPGTGALPNQGGVVNNYFEIHTQAVHGDELLDELESATAARAGRGSVTVLANTVVTR